MDLQLQGKIIIITGGGSGIGKAIALELADNGAVPCILDRDEEALSRFREEMKDRGKPFLAILTQLTDAASCKTAVTAVVHRFGKIDGLVNNAGVNDGVSLNAGTNDQFFSSLNNNVGHYYSMVYLTLPELRKTSGAVVNICSKVAETGQGGTSGYAAANGARLQLTKQWAVDFQKAGVRVNAIVVAECRTPLYSRWIKQFPDPEKVLNEIERKIPLYARMTEPEEVADMAVFLLSQRSSAINGEWVHVDGGYVHLDRKIS